MKNRIIITGANGFLGKALSQSLCKENRIMAISQKKSLFAEETIFTNDFLKNNFISKIVEFNPNIIIHAAAAAHKSYWQNFLNYRKYNSFNEDITKKLILIVNSLNIKKFLYVSSIGIYGNQTLNNHKIKESTCINPNNNYSKSKVLCEEYIKNNIDGSIILTIIRPSLVYGPNAPGNIRLLKKIINSRMPLPFKGIKNKRSLLYIGNFVSAVETILNQDKKESLVFVLSDQETISTEELISNISQISSKKVFLFKIPKFIFRLLENTPFLGNKIKQLTSNLVIDSSLIREQLNWIQPYSQKEGLRNSFLDT